MWPMDLKKCSVSPNDKGPMLNWLCSAERLVIGHLATLGLQMEEKAAICCALSIKSENLWATAGAKNRPAEDQRFIHCRPIPTHRRDKTQRRSLLL